MKKIDLDKQERRLVNMLDALGNPVRFRMLQYLSRCPECAVQDVVEQTPLAQSTVSQHLKVLIEAGLIHDEKAGAARCCTLDRRALAWFRDRVDKLVKDLGAGRGDS